ncbi:MAG TPA: Tat pathway signal sequence domain protein [Micromonosporaceae bacterium]
MRKFLYAVAVAATALFTATMMAGSASAATAVLTWTNSSGGAVSGTLSPDSGSATFNSTSGSSGVSCSSSSFSADVTANGSSSATESLTTQTFTNCTPHGLFCVNSIGAVAVDNLPFTSTVSSGGATTLAPGTKGPIQTTVTVNSCLGQIKCVYQATNGSLSGQAHNGTKADNSDNSLTFTNQPFSLVSGPTSVCINPANFSATYNGIHGSGGYVYTN